MYARKQNLASVTSQDPNVTPKLVGISRLTGRIRHPAARVARRSRITYAYDLDDPSFCGLPLR